jgi:hypothetical protein
MRLQADDSEWALSDHGRHGNEALRRLPFSLPPVANTRGYALGNRKGPGFPRPGPFAA